MEPGVVNGKNGSGRSRHTGEPGHSINGPERAPHLRKGNPRSGTSAPLPRQTRGALGGNRSLCPRRLRQPTPQCVRHSNTQTKALDGK